MQQKQNNDEQKYAAIVLNLSFRVIFIVEIMAIVVAI